ncbi:MAG: hypothetical protein U0527_16185 [Candidatus Eisenbacteria bacterium]
MQFLRDAMREPGGLVDLAPNTAVLLTGDTNFVGLAQQLRSFIDPWPS